MHQLTKDPSHLLSPLEDTESSPNRPFTPEQLARYLDDSNELLSLTSRTAALYAQDMSNPLVLSSVNEIETLTTGLSRKVWQKLVMLHDSVPGRG